VVGSGGCASDPDSGDGKPEADVPASGGGSGGPAPDLLAVEVLDADVIVELSHQASLADPVYAADSFRATFLPGPTWSRVGGVVEDGTCSDQFGLQMNTEGPAPVITGSDAVELVRTAPTALSTSIPLITIAPELPYYSRRWQGEELLESPWAAAATFDLVAGDGPTPLVLEGVSQTPESGPLLRAPAPNASISRALALTVEWEPGDAALVEIKVGSRWSCVVADRGSFAVAAEQMGSVDAGDGFFRFTRVYARRLERSGRVVHSMVLESLFVPVTFE